MNLKFEEDKPIYLSVAVIQGNGEVETHEKIPYIKSKQEDCFVYFGMRTDFSPFKIYFEEFEDDLEVDVNRNKLMFWSDSPEKALEKLIVYQNKKSELLDKQLHNLKERKKFAIKIRDSTKEILKDYKDENELENEESNENLTAEEIKKISKSKLSFYVKNQIEKINKEILKAANQGKFTIFYTFTPYFKTKTEEIISYFEDLGFKINLVETKEKMYDEQVIEISWK